MGHPGSADAGATTPHDLTISPPPAERQAEARYATGLNYNTTSPGAATLQQFPDPPRACSRFRILVVRGNDMIANCFRPVALGNRLRMVRISGVPGDHVRSVELEASSRL